MPGHASCEGPIFFSESDKNENKEEPLNVDIDELSTKAGMVEREVEGMKYSPMESDLERLRRELERIQNGETNFPRNSKSDSSSGN